VKVISLLLLHDAGIPTISLYFLTSDPNTNLAPVAERDEGTLKAQSPGKTAFAGIAVVLGLVCEKLTSLESSTCATRLASTHFSAQRPVIDLGALTKACKLTMHCPKTTRHVRHGEPASEVASLAQRGQ
jgi:hypothetical protein